jgi:tetratricopeptide (TPR) repeat protein
VLACLALSFGVWSSGGSPPEPTAVPTETPSPGPTPVVEAPSNVAEGAIAISIPTRRGAGVPARSAALLMSGQQGGAIGVSGLAVPVAASSSGVRLFFVLDVDGSTLLAGAEGEALPVEISVYALTPEGRVGGALTETFTLDVERAAEALLGGGIKFFGSLDLPAAQYNLRVLVRNVRVGTFGVIEIARAMPVAGEPFAFLSPPLVPEPAEAWLLAREAGKGADQPDLHPFPFLGEGEVPATAPVLLPGTASRFWVLARGVAPATTSYLVRVLDVGGKEVTRAQAALITRRESTMAGASALNLEVTLPALATGVYGLEVSAPSLNPDIQLWGWARFVAADRKAVAKNAVWVQFRADSAPAEVGPPAVAFVGKRGRGKASPKIKADYRSALRTLASDPVAARGTLAELETRLLPTGTIPEWQTLVLSELSVAGELAESRPDSTLGLALLHLELERDYTRTKSYLLEVHARRMVEELAVLYAERGAEANAKAIAANVLTSLAASLQRPGITGTSERLFRRALELDPANIAALLAMAANMERVGLYRRALDYLESLSKIQPDNPEGRLRLALNLMRVGHERRGAELLQACAGEGNPTWVRAIAYQEMALGFFKAERFDQAERLLREALVAVPGEEGLMMQLTYTLDRLRRPLDARALAKEIGAETGLEGDSPRFRYAEPPSEALAQVQAELTARAPAAREAIVSALEGKARNAVGGGG